MPSKHQLTSPIVKDVKIEEERQAREAATRIQNRLQTAAFTGDVWAAINEVMCEAPPPSKLVATDYPGFAAYSELKTPTPIDTMIADVTCQIVGFFLFPVPTLIACSVRLVVEGTMHIKTLVDEAEDTTTVAGNAKTVGWDLSHGVSLAMMAANVSLPCVIAKMVFDVAAAAAELTSEMATEQWEVAGLKLSDDGSDDGNRGLITAPQKRSWVPDLRIRRRFTRGPYRDDEWEHPASDGARDGRDGRDGRDATDGAPGPQGPPGPAGAPGGGIDLRIVGWVMSVGIIIALVAGYRCKIGVDKCGVRVTECTTSARRCIRNPCKWWKRAAADAIDPAATVVAPPTPAAAQSSSSGVPTVLAPPAPSPIATVPAPAPPSAPAPSVASTSSYLLSNPDLGAAAARYVARQLPGAAQAERCSSFWDLFCRRTRTRAHVEDIRALRITE